MLECDREGILEIQKKDLRKKCKFSQPNMKIHRKVYEFNKLQFQDDFIYIYLS